MAKQIVIDNGLDTPEKRSSQLQKERLFHVNKLMAGKS